MAMDMGRRDAAALLGLALAGALARPRAGWAADDAVVAAAVAAERRLGARIGVFVHDTADGRQWRHRADERFPMCSTFKTLACGALLARVDAGAESLDRRVRFAAADLVSWSPVTEGHAGGDGMTLEAVCAAMMVHSDNTAANLVLGQIGGPAGLTDFVRTLGDGVTRADRMEPAANECRPGDARDTTTPAAMAGSVQALVLGDRLAGPSRERLTGWMVATATGNDKLRTGLPAGWRVASRSGAGAFGTTNDVAVAWPPGRPPVIAAVYQTGSAESFATRNAAIAGIGDVIAAALGA